MSLREEIHKEMVKYNFLWSSVMTDKVIKIFEKRIDQERINLSIDNSEFANGWNHALGQLKFKIQHDES